MFSWGITQSDTQGNYLLCYWGTFMPHIQKQSGRKWEWLETTAWVELTTTRETNRSIASRQRFWHTLKFLLISELTQFSSTERRGPNWRWGPGDSSRATPFWLLSDVSFRSCGLDLQNTPFVLSMTNLCYPNNCHTSISREPFVHTLLQLPRNP